MLKLVLAGVLTAMSAGAASGQTSAGAYTSNDLLQDCGSATGGQTSSVQGARCMGFLQGMIASYVLLDAIRGEGKAHIRGSFCPPADVSIEEARNVVLTYLRTRQLKRMDRSALYYASEALYLRIPCDQPQPGNN